MLQATSKARTTADWSTAYGLILAAAVLTTAIPASAAAPTVHTGSTDQEIHLDGTLDEPAWQQAGVIADLTQQDPHPGGPTPFTTEVRVLVDATAIYIGFVCHDPDPSRIAIHTMQRDGNMRGDDTVAVVLDPIADGRRGYYFEINAAAARLDGLISGAEDMSTDWDGIWDAATRRTSDGWTAEIRIPAQTLRFSWGQDRWGFNVQRYVPRNLTTLRWSGITLDATLIDLQRAGQLVGVGALRQGLGLSLSPYGLIRSEKDFESGEQTVKGEAGGDLTWNFTGDLTGYLTINPDFAETEIDTRQVNLTRFPLFFPEKRTFFLEGSDIFDFGSGLGRDFIPFFSRRMGLYAGEIVPLLGGVKLLGRTGKWRVAALAVVADQTEVTQRTNLFSGRVTYDVDEHLTLGIIATDGDPEGESDNSLGGVDALWRTSTFGRAKDKNFSIGGWTASSRGDLPDGQRSGWGFKIDYPNDLWDLNLIVKEFGAGLDPALGFLPRPGTRWYQSSLEYRPRPKGGFFSWVRQFFFEFRPLYVEDSAGRAESWRVFTAPFNAQTQSGEHLEANIMPQFERLDEPFEIADGVVIPPGDYTFTRFRVEAQSSRHRPWRIGAEVWFGDFFTGSLTQTEAFVTYTTPSGHLQLELSAENDEGRLPEGDFTLNLGQFKAVYAFTPDLILSSFIQYDSESGDLGANTRFRWTIKPGNDFFVVWFHSWRHSIDSDKSFTLRPINDQLVVKLRWTFRW
jgi:hypothetical protein